MKRIPKSRLGIPRDDQRRLGRVATFIRLVTVLGNPVDDITSRDSAGQTRNTDAPPRVTYLSPDADVYSTELPSHPSAGHRTLDLVHGWLLSRIGGDALEFLCWAAHDFALWLANHDGREPFTLTIGWDEPRVLITLRDCGAEKPDLGRSRSDAAMIHRNLGHYVTEWECTVDDHGARTVRIYADVTVDKDADPEEPQ